MYTEGCLGALVGEMGEERKALVRRVREVEIRPHSLLVQRESLVSNLGSILFENVKLLSSRCSKSWTALKVAPF